MSANLNFPYSAQYGTTNREGHEHPPPTFGAPTLVWHLAISPHWSEDRPDFKKSLREIHGALARTYEQTRADFFKEINLVLTALQSAAGYLRGEAQGFKPETIPEAWQDKRTGVGEPFYVTSPGSVRFTLWWSDTDAQTHAEPGPDALRVKVHVGAHRDYVTLSFYLDASKPWNAPPQMADDIVGTRRKRILSEVDRVRSICERRLVPDAQGNRLIDSEVLPEHGVSGQDAQALLAASRLLYTNLWDDFSKTMGLENLQTGKLGRVFANFRGLVLATDGLPEAVEQRPFPGSSGAQPFPRFQGNGGIDHSGTRSSDEPNEANAAMKAFWPFVRRSIHDADRKEFVACGVMSWRALYATALNCPPAFEWHEEARSADTEVPGGNLPEDADGPAAIRKEEPREPIHYLLLTKGEPHRRQVGRIVERINSMGTMRLIALRDYGIVRDASTQIQLRGQELDTVMRKWSTKRSEIREKFATPRKNESADEQRKRRDKEDEALQDLADEVEADLIYLSAALDRIGEKAVHGLHFRINRSRYYIDEFYSLLASLKVGNIDTWVSYDQFVTRGLKPAFDFLDGVGDRLLGLRARLQTVLEGIETSALVTQISATRQNTAELRIIAEAVAKANAWLGYAIFWLRLFSIVVTLATLFFGSGGFEGIGKIIKWFSERIGQ